MMNFGVQERVYTVVGKEGKIEIRDYQPVISAQVRMMGGRDEAARQAFRVLVQFIKGDNTTQASIAMTAPVLQTRHPDDGWTVSFFMPADMSFSTVPDPLDSRIMIKQLSDVRFASIRFSGRGTKKNLAKYEAKLRDYLNVQGYVFIDTPYYAFYDPPFMPPFLRRNEVLFEIKRGVISQ